MHNDVAIFLDLDNIVIGATEVNLIFDINLVLEQVKTLTQGRIVLRRAYGDWRQNHNIPKALAAAGFELQSTVRLSHLSKNLADMQMVIDAMETLVDGHQFTTYVLMTGDRDFLPLVQALRKRGKQVIGAGLKHTSSRSLISLCDDYIFYEDIITSEQQIQAVQFDKLLKEALDNLLQEQDWVAASVLKEKMRVLSHGAFDKSPEGKMSFRKALSRYKDIVIVQVEGTTLYVTRADHPAVQIVMPQEETPETLTDESVEQLLIQAVQELLKNQERVRASVLKQRMQVLSNGAFGQTKQANGSFRKFLEQYPQLISVQQNGTTLYACLPQSSETTLNLHLEYRNVLKKRGLRVVPANIRLLILKDMITFLRQESWAWKPLVEKLFDYYQEKPEHDISKSQIQDVLRLARRANVMHIEQTTKSLASAFVQLQLKGAKVFQDAVMHCDATYLQELEIVQGELDLAEAAIALYDESGHSRYLKVVQNRFKGSAK